MKISETKPILSVLIPTYNQQEFIATCIDSVFSQITDYKIEVIVGDDCSVDNTFTAIEAYHDKAPMSVIYRTYRWPKNQGGLLNIDKLLAKASGKFIVILEGDDYWINENFLNIAINHMLQNPDLALCTGKVQARKEDNVVYRLPGKRLNHNTICLDAMLLGNFISMGCTVFRKRYCPQIYDEWKQLPLGDWPLFIRLLTKGKGHLLHEDCMVYRISPSGIWSQRGKEKQLQGTIETAKVVKKTLKLSKRQSNLLSLYISFMNVQLKNFQTGFDDNQMASLNSKFYMTSLTNQVYNLAVRSIYWIRVMYYRYDY